jgi:hypothetical protein
MAARRVVKHYLVPPAIREVRRIAMSAKDGKVQCPICGEYVEKDIIVNACGVLNYMCCECFMRVDVDIIGECSA